MSRNHETLRLDEPTISDDHLKVIDRLRKELFEYDNTIPIQNVTGEGNFKVRGNWFQGAIDALQLTACIAEDENWSNNQALQTLLVGIELEAERLRIGNSSVRDGRKDSFLPTTKEEIDRVDAWLVQFLRIALIEAGRESEANEIQDELERHVQSFRLQFEAAIAAK